MPNGLFQQGNAQDVTRQLLEQLQQTQVNTGQTDPIANQGALGAAQLFAGFNPQVRAQKKRDGLFSAALKKSGGDVGAARDSVITDLLDSNDSEGAFELIQQRTAEQAAQSAAALNTRKVEADISNVLAQAGSRKATGKKTKAETKRLKEFEDIDKEVLEAKADLDRATAELRRNKLLTDEQKKAIQDANTNYKKALARQASSQSSRLANESNFRFKLLGRLEQMVELGQQNTPKFKALEKLAKTSEKKDPTIELLERAGFFGEAGGVPAGATPGINSGIPTTGQVPDTIGGFSSEESFSSGNLTEDEINQLVQQQLNGG